MMEFFDFVYFLVYLFVIVIFFYVSIFSCCLYTMYILYYHVLNKIVYNLNISIFIRVRIKLDVHLIILFDTLNDFEVLILFYY